MEGAKNVEFPGFATEETYVFGITLTEAGIFIGSMGGIFLTHKVILPLAIGFGLYKLYKLYKEKGQTNIIAQLAYKYGVYVPESHIFPEPEVDSFRN
jgi:hypothetical protein